MKIELEIAFLTIIVGAGFLVGLKIILHFVAVVILGWPPAAAPLDDPRLALIKSILDEGMSREYARDKINGVVDTLSE